METCSSHRHQSPNMKNCAAWMSLGWNTRPLVTIESCTSWVTSNALLEKYDAIIYEQLEEGVVEEVEMPAKEKGIYIPHKAVIRENAATTKMRIVYDASARAKDTG